MLVFCTFGTSQGYINYCTEAIEWIKSRYSNSRTVLYTPADLPLNIREYCDANLKGYGFYRWKPWLVNHCMKSCVDGDILLYVDARSGFPTGRCDWLDSFVYPECSTDTDYRYIDLLAYLSTDADPERTRTNADLLHAFGSELYSFDAISGHIGASFFVVRANSLTRAFLAYWHDFYESFPQLCRDNDSLKRNHLKFVHNRYDQSVFSLTVKKFIRAGLRVGFLDQDDIRAENSIHMQSKPHPWFDGGIVITPIGLDITSLNNNINAVRSAFHELFFDEIHLASELEDTIYEPTDTSLVLTVGEYFHPEELMYLEIGIESGRNFLATALSSIRRGRLGLHVGVHDETVPRSILASAANLGLKVSSDFSDVNSNVVLLSRDELTSNSLQTLDTLKERIKFNFVYWNTTTKSTQISSELIELNANRIISNKACTFLVTGLEPLVGLDAPRWNSFNNLYQVLRSIYQNISLHGFLVGNEIGNHRGKKIIGILHASN